MLARIAFIALISLGVFGSGAMAQVQADQPVVVELYTSQGCSSCPPADAFLTMLADREDVIALGFHVDYWDYIGWKDKFGSPAYADRQRAYARAAGRRSIYTPQMIVQGEKDVVGNHPMNVTDLIRRYHSVPRRVSLHVTRGEGDALRIEAQAVKPSNVPYLVQIIRYQPQSTVDVKRGENAGHRLSYSNVVTDWRILDEWDARAPYSADVAVAGEKPVVVLIQRKGPGRIEAAARLR